MIVVSDIFVQNPKVSVVIITYNQEKYIAQAIESIVCQKTTFPFEVIIAEDCSTDSTRNVCVDYQKRYPNLIRLLLHEKNLGLIGNYKSALKECKGEYIAECGGDDFWCDEYKLQKHVDYMDQHDDVVVTYHDAKIVDADAKMLQTSFLPENRKINFSSDQLKKALLLLPQTMCFRNIVVKEVEKTLSPYVYNEDLFVTSILGNYGIGAYLSNINNTAYRILNNSIWMGQTSVKKTMMAIGSNAELRNYYKRKKDYKYSDYFRNKVISLFADVPVSQLSIEERRFFLTMLRRYYYIIGVKNCIHYLKQIFL